MVNKSEITVILNSYKRQKFLKYQINSLNKQSLPYEKILIWNNGKSIEDAKFGKDIYIANSSYNFGVWARFAFALNSESKYICMLDDDTMPGELFFENCIDTINKNPSLLGTRGLRFLSSKYYEPYISFGWDNPNDQSEIVDIVGHAWFFKREWLTYFWREMPLLDSSRFVGEDMHFSFMLKKYAGIRTVVPPHPKNDLRLWGSDPSKAIQIGTDNVSISQNKESIRKFDKALRHYTSNGISLCKDEKYLKSKRYFVVPRTLRNPIFKKIILNIPFLEKIARKLKNILLKKRIFF